MKHTYEAWQIIEWLKTHPYLSGDDFAIAARARNWADYEIPESFSLDGKRREVAARTRDLTAFADLRKRIDG